MKKELPPILAGPIIRHLSPREFTLWLVTSQPFPLRLQLFTDDGPPFLDRAPGKGELRRVQLGTYCFINLLHVRWDEPVAENARLDYELLLGEGEAPQRLTELLPDLLFPGRARPGCYSRTRIDNLLHGSCRQPHHPGGDALLEADALLARAVDDPAAHPDLLLFTGDQIYADYVAGPTLFAIHQVCRELGLFGERWAGAEVNDSAALLACPHCYYQRDTLLPKNRESRRLLELLFRGARKPIFTSASAHNHLITLAEVIAMYLLAWSPECWRGIDVRAGLQRLAPEYQERYRRECAALEEFVAGLGRARRLMANLPVYMIFDDHDITDDWNLSRGWEEAAYAHPFSRRIIGNALIAYWLCQGWGNSPAAFAELEERLPRHFSPEGLQEHDALVDALLAWERWHFRLDTRPAVLVLDTRTHRWRSESSPSRPSGLMDWESLTELQQQLIGEQEVILVSPTPVFGVKLIEAVQRVFAFFGKALMVDAENWMAHPGAANVILNVFRHPRTPPRFLILSGDVHYSFVYDVTLRFRRHSPHIVQVTASGIRHSFPASLLRGFDRCNAALFGSRSPLNFFTKRRRMQVEWRRPSHGGLPSLYNGNGIGQVLLRDGEVEARLLAEGGRTVVWARTTPRR